MARRNSARVGEIASEPENLIALRADPPGWTAIVLAGERPGGDPLARHFGSPSKAAIPIAGVSMIRRVVETLRSVPQIGRIVILAQDRAAVFQGDAAELCLDPRVEYAESGKGIASSIAAAMLPGTIGWPVLVTTADHALLTPAMVIEFLAAAQDCEYEVAWSNTYQVGIDYAATATRCGNTVLNRHRAPASRHLRLLGSVLNVRASAFRHSATEIGVLVGSGGETAELDLEAAGHIFVSRV